MTDLSREELYEIPIERLGLPIKAMNYCLRLGLIAVGDCVDAIEPQLRPACILRRPDKNNFLLNDVLPALIEQDYWSTPLNPRAFLPEIIDELKQKLVDKGYWSE